MKKNTKSLFYPFLTPIIFVFLIVASCSFSSNSLSRKEEQLKNILHNPAKLFSLKLKSNILTESVDNLFSNRDYFELVLLPDAENWNKNLSSSEEIFYKISPKIKNVNLPSFLENNKESIEELEVIVDLSTGPVDNKFVSKKLSINENLEIKNKMILNPNFTDRSLVFINQGQYKNKLEDIIRQKNINIDDIKNDSDKINSISFEKDDSVIFQDDVKAFYDVNGSSLSNRDKISVTIYFSKSKLKTISEIKQKSIYFHLNDVNINKKE